MDTIAELKRYLMAHPGEPAAIYALADAYRERDQPGDAERADQLIKLLRHEHGEIRIT